MIVALEFPAQVVVLGAVTGLTYGLLGVGLTLVYRTSRVVNFAHGQMGTLAAAFVPLFVLRDHFPVWPSVVASLAGAAGVGLVVERFVVRRLAESSRLLVLVATLGLSQMLLVAEGLIPRSDLAGKTYPTLFDATVTIGGVRLVGAQLQVLVFAPLLAIALDQFLRRSRLGLATRAAAGNAEVARLAGIPVHQVTAAAWMIASVLAAAAAVLSGPSRPVITTVAIGPPLMVRGLAAGLIGGFGRFPTVLAGGVGLGVIEALVVWNRPTGGLLELTMLAVVLVTIVVRRDLQQAVRGGEDLSFSLVGGLAPLPDVVRNHPRVSAARRIGIVAAVTVGAILPLGLENADRFLYSATLLLALFGLSLVVLTGMAGQLSLGQYAFVAVGAVVGGRLQAGGYPWLSGLLYAVLAGAVVAGLVGLPALRIRGVFLAVTTLAFAVAASSWLFRQEWLTHGPDGEIALRGRRPQLWGIDFTSELAYSWLCLGALTAVALGIVHLRRTSLGRAIVAVRDNDAAAAAYGARPAWIKLVAFSLSGAIASGGGYLYGGLIKNFSVRPEVVFAPALSIALVGIVVFGGITSVWGAIAAALWFRVLDEVLQPIFADHLGTELFALLTGGGLLLAVLQFPGGLVSAVSPYRDRVLGLLGVGGDVEVAPPPVRTSLEPVPTASHDADGPLPLEAHGIVVRFGGNTALAGVDLDVGPGEVVALLGSNGAGKTTLFDVLSGRLAPDAGVVRLAGEDVTRWPPEARARAGLGRTFQQARLFDDLTLREVLCVAQERHDPTEVVPDLLGLPPSRRSERAKRARADELLGLFGLDRFADRRVCELSTGMRRLTELAGQVAMGAPVILLDEPTAGVAQREVEAFGSVLRSLRDHLDASIVLIDHDIPMIAEVADRAVVLSAGAVVHVGPPDGLGDVPRVVAALLGTNEATIARSGPGGPS